VVIGGEGANKLLTFCLLQNCCVDGKPIKYIYIATQQYENHKDLASKLIQK
jgi:hypothetical protein